ncbi:hypothetical protein [Dactylosporangium sp. CA-092794]|uniref:hypothetical protein n=1 Tax=Dactylosporangium sp. CA-092794 TaxID=3239929 RepID=UPI003D944479
MTSPYDLGPALRALYDDALHRADWDVAHTRDDEDRDDDDPADAPAHDDADTF